MLASLLMCDPCDVALNSSSVNKDSILVGKNSFLVLCELWQLFSLQIPRNLLPGLLEFYLLTHSLEFSKHRQVSQSSFSMYLPPPWYFAHIFQSPQPFLTLMEISSAQQYCQAQSFIRSRHCGLEYASRKMLRQS